jgi:predicted lipoprotein with Yx(FWY)xxD motif
MSQGFRSKRSTGIVVAFVAACALAATAVGSTKTSTIALRRTAVGKVLVAANGRTLYLFTADKGKTSTCYGQCASFWPPLIAAKPSAGKGLKASLQEGRRRQGPGLRPLRRRLVGRLGRGPEDHG